ncbi:MAG: ceramidase domain-containing protein [Anaerolineae bacterium]|nr:ceramidase domain-containing protein [Anaerolineae bacterium]
MVKRRILLLMGFFALALVALCTVSSRARADEGEFPTYALMQPWLGLKPATCMPDRCFCERLHAGVIRQPINTWSNLAFVSVGVMTLAVAVRDFTLAPPLKCANPMRTNCVYPIIYGAVTVLIGLGSTLYHSSLAFVWQTVDVTSIYLLASFMLLYNVSRMRPMRGGVFVGGYLLANLVTGYAAIRWPVTRRYIVVLLILAVLVCEVIICRKRRPRTDRRFFAAACTSLALAGVAWILDISRVFCSPDSWLQAHALWHVFMAMTIGLIYFYYRSEDSKESVQLPLPDRERERAKRA